MNVWSNLAPAEVATAEQTYKRQFAEVLSCVPEGYRPVAVRPPGLNEMFISKRGRLRRRDAPVVKLQYYLIVERVHEPRLPVRLEYVGPFNGNRLVPHGHVAIYVGRSAQIAMRLSVFGCEYFARRGEYDLYRVVRV